MRYLIFLFFLGYQQVCFCQANININLPSIALLDIYPKVVEDNLVFDRPSNAGQSLQFTASSFIKWINFTSAVSSGSTRRVSVQITSGQLTSGYGITLETSSFTGNGAGNLGNSVPIAYLSNLPTTIVDNIGGAFTGVGVNNGYKLKFSLDIVNYGLLVSGSNTYSITYTLIDN